MYSSLKGKKVALTGAAGSFGQTFVEYLVKEGSIVYAISRTSSKLDALAKSQPTIIPILCDLTKWDDATKILTEKLPGDLDVLINNAGAAHSETLDNLTEAAVDEIINTNIKGTLCVTKLVSKKMIATGKGGSIINISSLASDFPCDFLLTYGMTKAALNRLTKTLATQLGPHNIRVNSINPTLIAETAMGEKVFETEEKKAIVTAFTPLKRFPTVEDVADSLMFLLSDKARGITGQIMFVDSGMHGG